MQRGVLDEQKLIGAGPAGGPFEGVDHAGDALGARCNGENAEITDAKMLAVRIDRPRACEIAENLLVKGGLPRVRAHDGHGAAIRLDKEIRTLPRLGVIETEDLVRDEANILGGAGVGNSRRQRPGVIGPAGCWR